MTENFKQLSEEERLLLGIYDAVGSASPKDIPNDDLRDRIYKIWYEIGDHLEKMGVNLVY